MAVQMDIDFEKDTVSKTVLDILRNGLREDPKSKVSYEECLLVASQGKKLAYGPANYLLVGLLRVLSIANGPIGDEFQPGGRQGDIDLGEDPSMSQTLGDNEVIVGSREGASGSGMLPVGQDAPDGGRAENEAEESDKKEKTPKYGKKETKNPPKEGKNKGETKGEICRFYANGKCKYNVDCRFQHPKICPKFRQNGDCGVKGCAGGCDFFHPNVCRNSLKDKTCSYSECKFFHLKGTMTVVRESKWRADVPRGETKQRAKNEMKASNSNNASKNRHPGLTPRTKNKNQNLNQKSDKKNPQGGGLVTKEENTQLGQALEAILRRLDAMEARTAFNPYQGSQIRPLLSPAVPQLGTQTQYQWGSQVPWTQSQTQN